MAFSYIYQQPNWPAFQWDDSQLNLSFIRHKQGLLLGKMKSLGFGVETTLETLTLEIIKSSAIEGETLDQEQVRSSIAKKLGLERAGVTPVNRHIDGIVEMMLDATQNYENSLTKERLWQWHGALFPTGYSGMRKIKVGEWRTEDAGPMQVISGPYGREKVHFEAPPSERIEEEMVQFLAWFNQKKTLDPFLQAGITHLWFVTIHPFEDGNGRISRALTDLCLARSDNYAQRFYSMSRQIELERKTYYDILEKTQKGPLDITSWLQWFLCCLERSIDFAEAKLQSVLHRKIIWAHIDHYDLTPRQRHVIHRLLEDFVGYLTTSKYANLAKCSTDTALREIQNLVEKGILLQNPQKGRSTSYRLNDNLGSVTIPCGD